MNLIISCLPGERRFQSVFVPLFLVSTRAIYHANSTNYLFEAVTQTAKTKLCQYQEAPNRIQQTAGSGGGAETRCSSAPVAMHILQQFLYALSIRFYGSMCDSCVETKITGNHFRTLT